jgi:hypothetical protein
VKDGTLQAKILAVFDGVRGMALTDGEVTDLLEARHERRFQRNVVARARLELEHKELIVRCPARTCAVTHQDAVTFRRASRQQQ